MIKKLEIRNGVSLLNKSPQALLQSNASTTDWDLDMSGEEPAYTQTRVTGSKASISNVSLVLENDFCSHVDEKHGGSDLS